MSELESVIENKLIDQLCFGDSQWTYRPDIRTEADLWANFKKILERNNKAALHDTPLSDSEFAKVKNDLSHASFYDAGRWLVGENGKVQVHVQRGNESLHLTVLNNEHIAGGSSVYEVINQYQAFREESDALGKDRRFDVTLLINGIPMIHIELKNKTKSYMDGYRQIKKYIGEGKFRGLFSNVQMFVVSNAIDTKYFAPAREAELNKEFLTGWIDEKNQPVGDYLDFAGSVLRIPQAHEMVARYIVLDNKKRRLLILRPYQIHAIEAMRSASKTGKSGYIWHTTGSGKTMTSYKSTRNLLMDIPSIDKTVFLIDRKDLDQQTTMAFQSYSENDTVDVDDTSDVGELIRRLSDGNRQMIVTTRQKMQTMVNRRLKEGSRAYEKIKNLRIAFVVDECHRAVTPQTKRDLERFFHRSLWYGFTGTPIFEVNQYEKKGDLAQTTEQLYGDCLHSYTIKEAIHDNAVLGFMVENLGPKGLDLTVEMNSYDTEAHMRKVLDVILNQSYAKFGMQNGRGQTYEAILTVRSIAVAQKYYDLLKAVKAGEDVLSISETVHQALPDFPKFAITYSLSENEEESTLNQDKMKEALADYNEMFGTHFGLEGIQAYNQNLNDRLARKEKRYLSRDQQLDLVIVVDRLLTGFDAPCLSTLFMDRQPMTPQNIIQAFSRTNRLFSKTKKYGQIVTFQSPDKFKHEIDEALRLYSRGGDGKPIAEDWDDVLVSFRVSLKSVRLMAAEPGDVPGLSIKQKKKFVGLFRNLDNDFAHLKAFSRYSPEILDELGFSQEEYEDYAAVYNNVVEELREPKEEDPDDPPIMDDYDLIAFNKFTIDYEYIMQVMQGIVDDLPSRMDLDSAEFERGLKRVREVVSEYAKSNARMGMLMTELVDQIERDRERFMGEDLSAIMNRMRTEAIDREVARFSAEWFIPEDDVKYEVYNYRDGEMANATRFKAQADYSAYKENTEKPLPKFKFNKALIEAFQTQLMPEVELLVG